MWIQDIISAVQTALQIKLFSIRSTQVTTGSLVILLTIYAATRLLCRLSHRGIQRFFDRKALTERANAHVLQRISQYLIMLTGGIAGLQVIGIDLSTLFAAGAIFAVGIGFAMQNIAQNFVSGIILLVERSIKQNDILEIEGNVVKVVKMGIRSTVVRTRNEEEIITPNSILVQGVVKNYTLSDSSYLLTTTVGVTYSSDMKRVRQVLEATGQALSWRDMAHEPRVLMSEFGDSSVNFKVYVWIHNPWEARRLTSQLNEAIWWALKEADIVIAFPQLDVHFDPVAAGAFTRR